MKRKHKLMSLYGEVKMMTDKTREDLIKALENETSSLRLEFVNVLEKKNYYERMGIDSLVSYEKGRLLELKHAHNSLALIIGEKFIEYDLSEGSYEN